MSDERRFSVVDVSKPDEATSKPRLAPCLGMSLGDIRLLPRWCPAYRQHEPGPGSRVERVKARPDTARPTPLPVRDELYRVAPSHVRHVNDREPSFIAHLPGPHLTRSCRAFSTTFKTTVFSQRPLPWFRAFFRKTALEGQQTSISHAAPQSTRPPFPSRLASCVRVHKPQPAVDADAGLVR